ncbi:MAG: PEPxxWA-CTERM sorting domain-containing protein [Polymorphobacter sp.]
MNKWIFSTSALAIALMAMPATAMQIFSTGYDMPNGDGQASGGSFNYWDKIYSGSGCVTCDGAPLTGGSGDLTDGVVAADFWYNVENAAGTGPYVGWYHPVTPNPVITFNFAGSPTITDIAVHLDNSFVGGVFSPRSILIDGVSTAFSAPAIGSIGWVYFTGLNLTGNSHTIELDQDLQRRGWTFVSEVTFAGNTVPEPASWGLMIAGFGMVGGALRTRRRGVVAA